MIHDATSCQILTSVIGVGSYYTGAAVLVNRFDGEIGNILGKMDYDIGQFGTAEEHPVQVYLRTTCTPSTRMIGQHHFQHRINNDKNCNKSQNQTSHIQSQITMTALQVPVVSEGKDELALSLASLAVAFNRLAVAVEGMLIYLSIYFCC